VLGRHLGERVAGLYVTERLPNSDEGALGVLTADAMYGDFETDFQGKHHPECWPFSGAGTGCQEHLGARLPVH
jgi:hypothetical protein